MKLRSLLCLLLTLTVVTPADAVINCFDYAFYRATGLDPRPLSSPLTAAVGVTSLECYLGALGYSRLPAPARDDSALQPGDVLIFGTSHAGFVNAQGRVDHFIQVWGTSGTKHPASALPPARIYLSPNPATYPDPPGNKPTGQFANHTLTQFMGSAFVPSGQVYQWRKTGPANIATQDILTLEIVLPQGEAALKAGKLNEAAAALAQLKSIANPPACLASQVAKLSSDYDRLRQDCLRLIKSADDSLGNNRLGEAAQFLEQAKTKKCNGDANTAVLLDALQRLLEDKYRELQNEIRQRVGACEYEQAQAVAAQIQSYGPAKAWLQRDHPFLVQQAEAQRQARQFLRTGLDAIQRKDLAGASAALSQASAVRDLPVCMTSKINELRDKIEKHKNFITLTEQVEQATIKCDYKEAVRLLGEITRITPREPYITDWINANVPKLNELQNRERNAIRLLNQAESLATQAEAEAAKDPADMNRVATLGQQAMQLLQQADQDAPKCLPERQRMEEIRRRLAALANRKKPEIAASIALLIDTSGSMAENNKINQAKDAARRAARQASKTTEIAILHFDGGCSAASMRPATGFTTDVNVLLAAIDKLQPGGGTPMYIATAAAVEYAQKHGRGKQRSVVLMSDGGDSCRDQQAQAAASIRSSNIPVSTIGFDVGNNQQAQGDLGNLATMTGGRTFSASAADPREIIRAFNLAMLPSLLKDFDFGNAASNIAGYFSQAKTMVQQQNVSGALMLLQQANSLAPNSPNLNFNLSLLYESQDQLIPAMNHANNYLRLAPQAIDRADVENRLAEIQKELQANPRVVMDSSGCREVLSWAQTEQDVAKRGRDVARRQGVLEILIAAQRGECEKAKSLQASYQQRFQ